MKTHLKTIGVLLLIALFVWLVVLTDGALFAWTIVCCLAVAIYWFVWSLISEREERNKRRNWLDEQTPTGD